MELSDAALSKVITMQLDHEKISYIFLTKQTLDFIQEDVSNGQTWNYLKNNLPHEHSEEEIK